MRRFLEVNHVALVIKGLPHALAEVPYSVAQERASTWVAPRAGGGSRPFLHIGIDLDGCPTRWRRFPARKSKSPRYERLPHALAEVPNLNWEENDAP